MTRYCVDPDRHELIATWGTGQGDLATRIATVPAGTDTAALSRLAAALTELSTAVGRTYTHPASAADSSRSTARAGAGSRNGRHSPTLARPWPTRTSPQAAR